MKRNDDDTLLPLEAYVLRSDVPEFDPCNPLHLRAWEAIHDYGRLLNGGFIVIGDDALPYFSACNWLSQCWKHLRARRTRAEWVIK